MSPTRSRRDTLTMETVFAALSELCTSPGYIHALSGIAVMNNFVNLAEGATAEQWMTYHRPSRLIRPEQALLAGLLIKRPIDYEQPSPETMKHYIARTHDLLHKLHKSFVIPWYPYQHHVGREMQEPIFYSAESAQPFQYRDFAAMRYRKDEQWISKNMGFSIEKAIVVADAIQRHQEEAVSQLVSALHAGDTVSDTSVFYQALTFSAEDVSATVDIDNRTVRAILRSFSSSPDERNTSYGSPGDFNIVRAQPIIRHDNNVFVLFDHTTLMESLYSSPYYWMIDTCYGPVASGHRGEFAEELVYRRLKHVFGEQHVFRNVEMKDDAGDVGGEIDVLVVYGNRVIIGQVKSKGVDV